MGQNIPEQGIVWAINRLHSLFGNVGAQPEVSCFQGWKSPQGLYNRSSSSPSGTGKGKPAANLGSTLPGPYPHLLCFFFFFFEIDSYRLLDGPPIRDANRGDSRESIRTNLARRNKKNYFLYSSSDSRESPQISNSANSQFLVPRNVIRKKAGSVREPSGDLRDSADSRESVN